MADISAGGAAATLVPEDPGREADEAAARRFEARTSERKEKMGRLAAGAAVADTPERVAKRTDRLRRHRAGEQLRSAPVMMPATESAVESAAGVMLERVINSADFVDIRYLEAGVAAARAVGRINIRNQTGRVVGYGTASLVSDHLVLTNHHVLPTEDVARWSAIELNYQDGVDGQPLQPRLFRLDPDRFFLADKEHDYAIVAVAAAEGELAEFGFNRLIDAEGKAVVGEFVTIVQHPKGEKKQVSLRENRVVDVLDSFLHYETDTEPGSSGSPVFNDQWEVVALHHASVPAPDRAELGHIMNEGIRVSALLRSVRTGAEGLPASMRSLLDGLFQDERAAVGTRLPSDPAPPAPASVAVASVPAASVLQPIRAVDSPRPEAVLGGPDGFRFTVPVEIVLRLVTGPVASSAGGSPSTGGSAVVLTLPDAAGWPDSSGLLHQVAAAGDLML